MNFIQIQIKVPAAFFLLLLLVLVSCGGSSDDPEPDRSSINKMLYRITVDNTINDLWRVNEDGTGKEKLNITLPAGWKLDYEDMAEISPDKQNLLLLAYNQSTQQQAIYKCNIDGANIQRIGNPESNSLAIQGFIGQSAFLYWKVTQNQNYTLELWRMNLDGTNNQKINIALPANTVFGDEELAKITADGQTIVFITENKITTEEAIYKCNIDGSNLTLVARIGSGFYGALQTIGSSGIYYRKSYNANDIEELWAVNADGSNNRKINVGLPAGWILQNEEMAVASKSGGLFVLAENTSSGQEGIFICAADGSSVKMVTQETSGSIALQSSYQ